MAKQQPKKNRQIPVRVDDATAEAFKEYASEYGVSEASILRRVIWKLLHPFRPLELTPDDWEAIREDDKTRAPGAGRPVKKP